MSGARLPICVLAVALTVGCFGSKRDNSGCSWPAHTWAPLNLTRASDRTHLSADVRLAEELAIRYGDVRWGPGQVRRERSRQECLEPLFATITTGHEVARTEIDTVREAFSHRGANLTTNIPMTLFCLGVSALLLRRIARRFSPREERIPFVVMAVLASGLVAVTTVGVGGIWEGGLEMWRVGNDHLGYRGLRLQWVQHRPQLMLAAMALFWVIAAAYVFLAARCRPSTATS